MMIWILSSWYVRPFKQHNNNQIRNNMSSIYEKVTTKVQKLEENVTHLRKTIGHAQTEETDKPLSQIFTSTYKSKSYRVQEDSSDDMSDVSSLSGSEVIEIEETEVDAYNEILQNPLLCANITIKSMQRRVFTPKVSSDFLINRLILDRMIMNTRDI